MEAVWVSVLAMAFAFEDSEGWTPLPLPTEPKPLAKGDSWHDLWHGVQQSLQQQGKDQTWSQQQGLEHLVCLLAAFALEGEKQFKGEWFALEDYVVVGLEGAGQLHHLAVFPLTIQSLQAVGGAAMIPLATQGAVSGAEPSGISAFEDSLAAGFEGAGQLHQLKVCPLTIQSLQAVGGTAMTPLATHGSFVGAEVVTASVEQEPLPLGPCGKQQEAAVPCLKAEEQVRLLLQQRQYGKPLHEVDEEVAVPLTRQCLQAEGGPAMGTGQQQLQPGELLAAAVGSFQLSGSCTSQAETPASEFWQCRMSVCLSWNANGRRSCRGCGMKLSMQHKIPSASMSGEQ